jgi:hypothetical protein
MKSISIIFLRREMTRNTALYQSVIMDSGMESVSTAMRGPGQPSRGTRPAPGSPALATAAADYELATTRRPIGRSFQLRIPGAHGESAH